MARTFTSSTTDSVITSAFSIPSAFSIYYWQKNVDTNVLSWGFANDVLRSWFSGPVIGLSRVFASSGYVSSTATPGVTLANWNHYCWTHDGTTAGPVFYINGTPISLTSTWSAVGDADTSSKAFCMGNNPGGGAFATGGSQAHYGFHNVVLTPGEVVAAMRFGFTPRGLLGAWPLLGGSPEVDISGLKKAGTVTGTTVVPGPPIVPSLIPMFALAA